MRTESYTDPPETRFDAAPHEVLAGWRLLEQCWTDAVGTYSPNFAEVFADDVEYVLRADCPICLHGEVWIDADESHVLGCSSGCSQYLVQEALVAGEEVRQFLRASYGAAAAGPMSAAAPSNWRDQVLDFEAINAHWAGARTSDLEASPDGRPPYKPDLGTTDYTLRDDFQLSAAGHCPLTWPRIQTMVIALAGPDTGNIHCSCGRSADLHAAALLAGSDRARRTVCGEDLHELDVEARVEDRKRELAEAAEEAQEQGHLLALALRRLDKDPTLTNEERELADTRIAWTQKARAQNDARRGVRRAKRAPGTEPAGSRSQRLAAAVERYGDCEETHAAFEIAERTGANVHTVLERRRRELAGAAALRAARETS